LRSDQNHIAPTAVPSAITLQRATPSDATTIVEIMKASWLTAYIDIMGPRDALATFERCMSLPILQLSLASGQRSDFWGLALHGGEPAGIFSLSIGPLGRGRLHTLYVHPQHQGRGIGGTVLANLPNIFPWARSFQLQVLEPNHRAIEFYRARGFEKIGVTHSNPFTTVPIITMICYNPNAPTRLQAFQFWTRRVSTGR
jgi:ribosomal protein S18 acetylase RimI-like enzyme